MNFQKIEGFWDSNSCSVLAYSICYEMEYKEAYARLSSLGRIESFGVNFARLAPELGLLPRPDLVIKMKTVGRVQELLTSGNYIVRISGHVFAIKDGLIYDVVEPQPQAKIRMIYENTKTRKTASS